MCPVHPISTHSPGTLADITPSQERQTAESQFSVHNRENSVLPAHESCCVTVFHMDHAQLLDSASSGRSPHQNGAIQTLFTGLPPTNWPSHHIPNYLLSRRTSPLCRSIYTNPALRPNQQATKATSPTSSPLPTNTETHKTCVVHCTIGEQRYTISYFIIPQLTGRFIVCPTVGYLRSVLLSFT